MALISRLSFPKSIVALAGLALVVSMVGCNNAGYTLSDENTSAMKGIRAKLVDNQTAIDKTTTAVSDLTSTPTTAPTTDIRTQFDNFCAQVDSLNGAIKGLDGAMATLKAKNDAYMLSWDKDIAAISDPLLQQKAKERRKTVSDKVNALGTTIKTLRDAEDTYVTHLNDLRALLNHDLTPAGIAGASDAAKAAYESSKSLRSSLNEALNEIDELTGGLTPGAATQALPAK